MPKSRISRVTTRTGDSGQTRLATGKEVPKTHPFIRALGAVDELNSSIGVLLSLFSADGDGDAHRGDLVGIQQALFDMGAFVAMEGEYDPPNIEQLDERIAELNSALEPLTEFVLPGGSPSCAQAHFCRAVCRRVELALWGCVEQEPAFTPGARYLNRLGDYFFVLARTLADDEAQWHGPPA